MDSNYLIDPTLLSLKVSCFAILLETVPAVAIGWLISKGTFKAKWLLDLLVTLPVVLTPLIIGFFLLETLSPLTWFGRLLHNMGFHLIFNWKGAVVAVSFVSFPLFVQSVVIAFNGVDERLDFAAQSLGLTPIESFFRVALPLAWRGILGGAILAFARNMGEFGATAVIAGNMAGETETLPLAIYSYINSPDGDAKVFHLVIISLVISGFSILLIKLLGKKRYEAFS